jgi:6,7-dimethyl-8-ribityllumazine synthase
MMAVTAASKTSTSKSRLSQRRPRYAVVVSRFNDFITKNLLQACLDELQQAGVHQKEITTVWVPGAFEIVVPALKFAKKRSIDAVICLGAVIRGETIHFDLVAQNAAAGIREVALMTGKPVIFGVIATDTINQAYKRSQPDGDNKGRDAALAAIEMVKTLTRI